MKITLFCNTLNGGGAEHVMKTLSRCFAQKGHAVDFLISKGEGVYINEVKEHANLINLNCRARFIIPKLITYIKGQKPDVILSTQTHINIASIIATKLSNTNTKIVTRETTTLSEEFKSESGNSLKTPFFYKSIYNKADKLVTVSEGSKLDLIQNFKIKSNKIHTIYNPIISPDLFIKAQEKIDHPWLNKKIPVIVSMGRFAKAKDYTTLLKAFKLVRETRLCKLIILGNSTYDNEVRTEMDEFITKNRLNNFVRYEGFKSNPFPYLKLSNVYVLSSIYEGLPGALVQAFALGCPIVSTNCPSGPSEILEHEKNISLVVVGDYKDMAKKILYHIDKRKDYTDLRKEKMKLFEEKNITNQYLSLFKTLTN